MKYVQNADALHKVCEALEKSSWAAVDTEADSLHHYTEKLCLVQISIEGEDFVIDPLAGFDLARCFKILSSRLLLFHGADFDIRLIRKFYPFEPKEIFDSLAGAQLLGYPKQGLADLVSRYSGVTLSKKAQRADWSKRPLESELLEYAANDTHYLNAIRGNLEIELTALGRLEWHREYCQAILAHAKEARAVESSSGPPPWFIKGARHLKGKTLTYLRELWLWRKAEAEKKDRPVFKILNSEYLVAIALWATKNPNSDIHEWRESPRNVRNEYRHALNEVLARALIMPPVTNILPAKKKQRQWDTAQNERFKELKVVREKIAAQVQLQPSLVATNAELEILATKAPRDRKELESLDCLMSWQIGIAGEEFLHAINSRYPREK